LSSCGSSTGKNLLRTSLSSTLDLGNILISFRSSYRDSWSNFFCFLFLLFGEGLLDSNLRLNELLFFSLWQTNVDYLQIINLSVRRTVRIRKYLIDLVHHGDTSLLSILPENIWFESSENLSYSVINSWEISCKISLLIVFV
jgi:hypothetical protein